MSGPGLTATTGSPPGADPRVVRASAVIVQRVPAADVDWFLDWQAGVARAAEVSGGYRGADVFPPSGGKPDEWVVIIHFTDEKALGDWLSSPARVEWVGQLRAKVGDFALETLPGGFGPWFARRAAGPAAPAPAPGWKMALTVLLGLFPTVMLLTIVVGPYTSPWGLAASMLIGNALSISVLQWVVMPVLTALLGPWLNADDAGEGVKALAPPCLILLLLVTLMLLFRPVTG